MLDKQSQSAAEGAIAIQAQGNVQVGLTYQEARQVALDVYQANFPQLVEAAASLARARAEELTDKFLHRLSKENPGAFSQAMRPDFQNALLNAQKEHACAGDEQLADLLVDLLVDRTRTPQRSLLQLVLDEALKTAPKLTEQQLAVLGLVFLIGHSRSTGTTWPAVVSWMNEFVRPVVAEAQLTASTLQHLSFTGCANINSLVHSEIAAIMLRVYRCYFQEGLSSEEVATSGLSDMALAHIKSMEGQVDKMRVAIVSDQVIDLLKSEGAFEEADADKLKALLGKHLKSAEEVKSDLISQMPYFQKIIDLWERERLCQLSLTSVGMAIGHAYVKKVTKKEFASLEIWIK